MHFVCFCCRFVADCNSPVPVPCLIWLEQSKKCHYPPIQQRQCFPPKCLIDVIRLLFLGAQSDEFGTIYVSDYIWKPPFLKIVWLGKVLLKLIPRQMLLGWLVSSLVKSFVLF